MEPNTNSNDPQQPATPLDPLNPQFPQNNPPNPTFSPAPAAQPYQPMQPVQSMVSPISPEPSPAVEQPIMPVMTDTFAQPAEMPANVAATSASLPTPPQTLPPLPTPMAAEPVITVGNAELPGPGPVPVVSNFEPTAVAAQPSPGRRSSRFKPLLFVAALLVVLGGGSAAAYYGVVAPNKPANLLKTALSNSLQQTQASFTGTLEGSSTSSSGLDFKVGMSGSGDSVTKTADVILNITTSGVTFPIEARLVNKNIYVKVGDLTPIVSLMSATDPSLTKLGQSLSGQLSNKWIVVDSTLVDDLPGASCILNANISLTKSDLQLLQDQYVKHQFATIQSNSSDTVNGKAAEKFNLSLDDDTLTAYVNNLGSLSPVKSMEKCQQGSSSSFNETSTADHSKTPLTVWVDKSTKRIVQIAAQSTPQDATNGVKGSVTLDLSYGNVSIAAPANAEPLLQVITGLETSLQSSGIDPTSLIDSFTGSTTANTTNLSSKLSSTQQTNTAAFQKQLHSLLKTK